MTLPPARRRRRRVLAVLPALALAAAACSQPLHAAAAATVGDAAIPTAALRTAVEQVLADPSAARVTSSQAVLIRGELSMLIDHRLLLDLAAREGVVPTGQQVDAEQAALAAQAGGYPALVAQAAQLGIPPAGLRLAVEDAYLRNAIADRLTAAIPVSAAQLRAAYQRNIAQYDQVDAAQILVSSHALAERVYRLAVADPASFAQLAARYSQDPQTRDRGGVLGFAGPGSYVPAFDAAVFSHPPGAIVPPVHTQYGWHVIKILARRVVPLAQVRTQLREQILSSQRQQALDRALAALAAAERVEVNPQYGVWSGGQVAPPGPAQELASPAPGAASAVSALGGGLAGSG